MEVTLLVIIFILLLGLTYCSMKNREYQRRIKNLIKKYRS